MRCFRDVGREHVEGFPRPPVSRSKLFSGAFHALALCPEPPLYDTCRIFQEKYKRSSFKGSTAVVACHPPAILHPPLNPLLAIERNPSDVRNPLGSLCGIGHPNIKQQVVLFSKHSRGRVEYVS